MTFRPLHILWPVCVEAAFLFGGLARAQLSSVSPFLPPDSGLSAAPSGPNAVEYRGLMSTSHGYLYLIYDPAKKASFWVGLNEPGAPYAIRSDDPLHEKISVFADGQQLSLSLKEAKVAAAAPTFNQTMAVGSPAGTAVGPAILRPTPEDEQRRLQLVAEEVRRRRQQREQAAQQQGGPP